MQEIIDRVANALYAETCGKKEHSRIYKLHKYWARKPWYIVEKYIQDYSCEGDLVMDPFCGSGCMGLEAVINGRNFKGQDLNPIALLVARGTLAHGVDLASFQEDLAQVEEKCRDRIMRLYEAEQYCEKCGQKMYFKHINIGPKFQGEYTAKIYCPNCKSRDIERKLTDRETEVMKRYDGLILEKWVPDAPFPDKFYKDRFTYKGIYTVADMYTKRNLYALSLLYDAVMEVRKENRELMTLAFTNTVLHASKLKGENVRPLGVNNYWIPDDYMEENVWFRFADRVKILIRAKKQQSVREREKQRQGISYGNWTVEKKSALADMGKECVDYFFTDPPYGDAIQYSELSFVWNAWLKESYRVEEEIIINPMQEKGPEEFQELLSRSLEHIYAALKNEKYFTLCFQNKNADIWKAVILQCKRLGFKLTDVSVYNAYGNPFNKNWANFSPKSDIYVTFQKSNAETYAPYQKEETVEGIVEEVYQYMREHKIAADNNKLYDLVISYLIWAIYLNRTDIDVKGFDIKKFIKTAKRFDTAPSG